MMKPATAIVIAALLIVGCAVVKTAEKEPVKNPRIVYRDLTKAVRYPVPPMPGDSGIDQKEKVSSAQPDQCRPRYFIEFANESFTRFDEHSVLEFTAATPLDSRILVIGHSHGKSSVGTLRLSSKRAETVSRYLKGRGYQNVHVMASWGGKSVTFAPSRGVHLYVLVADEQSETLPVVFAKTVENKVKEEPNGNLEIHGEVAGCRPAKNHLGDV